MYVNTFYVHIHIWKVYAPIYADIEDGYEGVWKNSYTYKWELLDKFNQNIAKKQMKVKGGEEQERMYRETEYIDNQLSKRSTVLDSFLSDLNGQSYILSVAKLIILYVQHLAQIIILPPVLTPEVPLFPGPRPDLYSDPLLDPFNINKINR